MNGVLYFDILKRSCAFLSRYFATNQSFSISRISVQTETLWEDLTFITYYFQTRLIPKMYKRNYKQKSLYPYARLF
jgi:hypothetical protein